MQLDIQKLSPCGHDAVSQVNILIFKSAHYTSPDLPCTLFYSKGSHIYSTRVFNGRVSCQDFQLHMYLGG